MTQTALSPWDVPFCTWLTARGPCCGRDAITRVYGPSMADDSHYLCQEHYDLWCQTHPEDAPENNQ